MSNETKREACYSEFENSDKDPGGEECRECWKAYIEQQEPDDAPLELNTVKNLKVKIGTITDMEPPSAPGDGWISVKDNQLPSGSWQVYLKEKILGSKIQIATYDCPVPVVAGRFLFDLKPNYITHYRQLPKDPPEDN